jgi:hypothetical protein
MLLVFVVVAAALSLQKKERKKTGTLDTLSISFALVDVGMWLITD